MWNTLLMLPLYVLPKKSLSHIAYIVTRCQIKWVKNLLIRLFLRVFAINMAEAKISDPSAYANFNAFFTRALKQGARPIATAEDIVISPVDGKISQIGTIEQTTLLQAKGYNYTLHQLLAADEEMVSHFRNGRYATLYLSPADYHRVHMPLAGNLQKMRYVPGERFPVGAYATRTIKHLFARNERLINLFQTETGDFMALVMVGAIFVGNMTVTWHNEEFGTSPATWQYNNETTLAAGAEMGQFNMGSTVILLLPKTAVWLEKMLQTEKTIRIGEAIARTRMSTTTAHMHGNKNPSIPK